MLTLPDTLTPHQLRELDAAIYGVLHPDDKVEWRWVSMGYSDCEPQEVQSFYINEPDTKFPRYDADYQDWCALDNAEVDAWIVLPHYIVPGAANNEVEEAMIHGTNRELNTSYKDKEYLSLLVESDEMFGNFIASGYGSTLALAKVAAFCDWRGGIQIPKPQP